LLSTPLVATRWRVGLRCQFADGCVRSKWCKQLSSEQDEAKRAAGNRRGNKNQQNAKGDAETREGKRGKKKNQAKAS